MKPIEIHDLVVGLMTIIVLALSLGQLNRLHDFAKVQAAQSLKGWKPHPFFPKGFNPVVHKR